VRRDSCVERRTDSGACGTHRSTARGARRACATTSATTATAACACAGGTPLQLVCQQGVTRSQRRTGAHATEAAWALTEQWTVSSTSWPGEARPILAYTQLCVCVHWWKGHKASGSRLQVSPGTWPARRSRLARGRAQRMPPPCCFRHCVYCLHAACAWCIMAKAGLRRARAPRRRVTA